MEPAALCGTRIELSTGVAERIPPVLGDLCSIVRRLESPPERLYVRVNTSRVSVEEYQRIARESGVELLRDEEVPCALWARVEGPFEPRRYPGRVVADKRASESVLMGSDLYAPGVIMAGGFQRGDMVSIYSPNGVHVGSGVAAMGPHEMVRSRRGLAVRVTEPVYRSVRVTELPGYREGLIYGQSLPSMYVGLLYEPGPGDLIVDLTAAPGGKVSHIAQRARELGVEARIIAVDRPSKVPRLRETLERLGLLDSVEVVGADARRITRIMPGLEGRASLVLVDPPCSNLGVRPKVWERRSSRDIVNYARYQRGFLGEAARLLRPGGTLVYSTCTLVADENQGNRAWAIAELGLEPAGAPRFARPLRGGTGELLFSPLQGTPGFYIAVLRRPG